MNLKTYPNTHEHFPDDLVYDLKAMLPWEELPSERDAKSVAFIMRLRSGRGSSALDRNRASLVSSNVNFADISRRFCVSRHLIKGNQIGPVLHRRQLAAILWLTLGSDEKKEVTRRELLQRCADVVRLNPHVVRKARGTLLSFDSEKASQFEALIATPRGSQMMMDLTLGVPDLISNKTMDKILDELKKTTAEELQKEHKEKVKILERKQRERERRREERHVAELTQARREKDELELRAQKMQEQVGGLAKRVELLKVDKSN